MFFLAVSGLLTIGILAMRSIVVGVDVVSNAAVDLVLAKIKRLHLLRRKCFLFMQLLLVNSLTGN